MADSISDLVQINLETPGTDPAEHTGDLTAYESQLPPGVDPMDRSIVLTGLHPDANAVHLDQLEKQYRQGHKPYAKENWEALQTFQRSARNGQVRIVGVNSGINGGTALAVAAQPGRTALTLSVPSKLPDGVTVPPGVTWAFSEGDLQGASNMNCGVLNPGDSVTIACEAEVWVGLIGGNISGFVQVLQLFNAPGGPGVQ